ncbi:hypothetical protein HMN09_00317200 [Mycena chlorophos]|uniref:Rap1 Myb domain-containing protein n=1 Tax=Mycena chlorophos TaxID=658473 RepID=A0A8H6WKI3_MYCCL|nr:hypothetical protein HMN09_00317200 [Mycena chlorophos]
MVNGTKFTAEEDRNLVEYLACARPEDGSRKGEKIYKTLVSNPDKWPWSRTHPYISWAGHYHKASASFDLRIEQYLKNGRRHPEDSNAKDPDAKVRVLVHFTEDDIQNLCVFLAEKTPAGSGRRRGGIVLYNTLVEDEDGTRPWAKRHSAMGWSHYYNRHREVLDPRISAIQLGNANVQQSTTGTERPKADARLAPLPESAPPRKDAPGISATRKRPLHLDSDEDSDESPSSSSASSLEANSKRSTRAAMATRRLDQARKRLRPMGTDFDSESEDDEAPLKASQRSLRRKNPPVFEEEEESECSNDDDVVKTAQPQPSLPPIETLTRSTTTTSSTSSSEPVQEERRSPAQRLRDLHAIFDEDAVGGSATRKRPLHLESDEDSDESPSGSLSSLELNSKRSTRAAMANRRLGPARKRLRLRVKDTESEDDSEASLPPKAPRRSLRCKNPYILEEGDESDDSSDDDVVKTAQPQPSLPGIETLTQSTKTASSEPVQEEPQRLRDKERPPLPVDGTSPADEDMGPSHEEPIATPSARTSLTERIQALAAARRMAERSNLPLPAPSSPLHTFDMHAYLFDDVPDNAVIDTLSAMVVPQTAAAAARPPKRRPGDGPVQKPLPVFFASMPGLR